MNNVFVWKRLLPIMLALTAAAVLVACDEDSDSGKSDLKSSIVGHWHSGEKIDFMERPYFHIYSYSANGRYEAVSVSSGSISRFEGRYKLVGRELTEFNETPVAYTSISMVEMDDDASTLTLHDVDADGSMTGLRTTYRRISKDEYNEVLRRYDLL